LFSAAKAADMVTASAATAPKSERLSIVISLFYVAVRVHNPA
jgi:hypothetical protein